MVQGPTRAVLGRSQQTSDGPSRARQGARPARSHVATHVIVGGGLAGGLIAWALARAGRGRGVVLIDQETHLGGDHTWSFHKTDLDPAGETLVQDLVTRVWPGHVVRFPGYERMIDGAYATIRSDQFAGTLAPRLLESGVVLSLGRQVTEVGASAVRFDDGTVVRGDLVIDARGPERDLPARAHPGGFQKFVGLELELESDGPWQVPVLMDATVTQTLGYRFTYVLPYSPRHVLVEDTIYSRNPFIDRAACEQGILDYAARKGAKVGRLLRREIGVLPLPGAASTEAETVDDPGVPLKVGYRGGFFHDVTGYSLPLAVRVALAIAGSRDADETRRSVADLSQGLRPQHRFGRLLNRLTFDAMPATERWTAFERFYRLPDATIARFYASRSTWRDRARILLGRPPAGISWTGLLSGMRRTRPPQLSEVDSRRD